MSLSHRIIKKSPNIPIRDMFVRFVSYKLKTDIRRTTKSWSSLSADLTKKHLQLALEARKLTRDGIIKDTWTQGDRKYLWSPAARQYHCVRMLPIFRDGPPARGQTRSALSTKGMLATKQWVRAIQWCYCIFSTVLQLVIHSILIKYLFSSNSNQRRVSYP